MSPQKLLVAVPVLLRALDAASLPLTSVEVRRPTLDDVMRHDLGRELPLVCQAG